MCLYIIYLDYLVWIFASWAINIDDILGVEYLIFQTRPFGRHIDDSSENFYESYFFIYTQDTYVFRLSELVSANIYFLLWTKLNRRPLLPVGIMGSENVP
jgi:hypothetical protein